jgi:hypothetical protein
MWSGTIASIPAGWVLCDGSNSTPDLRARFIKGAAAGANPGRIGGDSTISLGYGTIAFTGTQGTVPAQTFTGTQGTVPAETFTGALGTLAVTAHTVVSTKQGSSTGNVVTTATHTFTGVPGGTNGTVNFTPAGTNGTVNFTPAGTISGSTASGNNDPAFYSLAFIMKQ